MNQINMTVSLGGAAAPAKTEAEARADLAAAFRLAAHFGWDDLLATHMSVRTPGEETFLINPFGLMFEEVTASSLVKVDLEGNIRSNTHYPVNAAGFTIHSAIHEGRPDVGCVIHLHTEAGIAVSGLEEGLLPLNQNSMLLAPEIAYHDYEGVAIDLSERERLQHDLGEQGMMILRNHGTLTVGTTVAAAFTRMFSLERACRLQCATLAQGRKINLPSKDALEKTAALARNQRKEMNTALAWAALRRKLDRITTDYLD